MSIELNVVVAFIYNRRLNQCTLGQNSLLSEELSVAQPVINWVALRSRLSHAKSLNVDWNIEIIVQRFAEIEEIFISTLVIDKRILKLLQYFLGLILLTRISASCLVLLIQTLGETLLHGFGQIELAVRRFKLLIAAHKIPESFRVPWYMLYCPINRPGLIWEFLQVILDQHVRQIELIKDQVCKLLIVQFTL